jgi:hypothetical protein
MKFRVTLVQQPLVWQDAAANRAHFANILAPLAGTTDLVVLYHAGADSPGTYNEGIDLVTRGILQSVGFLYVTALGSGGTGAITLTKDELASTLGYLVAGGPPDATLTAADLSTPDARETQVRRLVATQPGRDRMVRVVREWLGVDRIADTAKDTTVYKDWTTAMRTSMDGESKKFIDEVVQRSTGTVGELLSANWSIYDSGLNALGIAPTQSYVVERRPVYVTKDGKGKVIPELFS